MGRRDGLRERTGMGREEREGVEERQEEKKRVDVEVRRLVSCLNLCYFTRIIPANMLLKHKQDTPFYIKTRRALIE